MDNRPYDGIATVHGRAIPIEIKTGQNYFRFADLKDHQIEGLQEWSAKHGYPTWIWIQMGTAKVTAIHNPNRRRVWLMPLYVFLGVRDYLAREGLKGISLNIQTTKRLEHKERELYATSQFKHYELDWNKDWELPTDHLFHEMYRALTQGAQL